MGAGTPAGRLRVFQPQHPHQQRRGLLVVSRANQSNAAGIPGFDAADGLVPGLPSQPGSCAAASRSGFQYELAATCEPGGNWETAGGGVQNPERGAIAKLFHLSSLTI